MRQLLNYRVIWHRGISAKACERFPYSLPGKAHLPFLNACFVGLRSGPRLSMRKQAHEYTAHQQEICKSLQGQAARTDIRPRLGDGFISPPLNYIFSEPMCPWSQLCSERGWKGEQNLETFSPLPPGTGTGDQYRYGSGSGNRLPCADPPDSITFWFPHSPRLHVRSGWSP